MLTYARRRGRSGPKYLQPGRVLIDRSAGLLMHIHSENGHRTITFLDDVPSHSIAVSDDGTRNTPLQAGSDLPDVLMEGQQSSVTLIVFERNPIARLRCLEHYGTTCSVCDFSFSRLYGQAYADAIHVHHLTPISMQATESETCGLYVRIVMSSFTRSAHHSVLRSLNRLLAWRNEGHKPCDGVDGEPPCCRASHDLDHSFRCRPRPVARGGSFCYR